MFRQFVKHSDQKSKLFQFMVLLKMKKILNKLHDFCNIFLAGRNQYSFQPIIRNWFGGLECKDESKNFMNGIMIVIVSRCYVLKLKLCLCY